MENKRELGKYYTKNSPFDLKIFRDWSKRIGLDNEVILEPFAGSNNIVKMLHSVIKDHVSYDIEPMAKYIIRNNSFEKFPKGYKVCITNPPWLSNYSAKRKNLFYPSYVPYDDLYKYSIDLALKNCQYVAMILPASFLNSGLFRSRLFSVSLLPYKIFDETDNPSCLALFDRQETEDFLVYRGDEKIGYYHHLRKRYCSFKTGTHKIKFNIANGKLGLKNLDSTQKKAIQFCHSKELSKYDIKFSSRLITKINIDDFNITDQFIILLNTLLEDFRNKTSDIFLTPFKGLCGDDYRRRLDYNTARGLINVGLRKTS